MVFHYFPLFYLPLFDHVQNIPDNFPGFRYLFSILTLDKLQKWQQFTVINGKHKSCISNLFICLRFLLRLGVEER